MDLRNNVLYKEFELELNTLVEIKLFFQTIVSITNEQMRQSIQEWT